MVRELKEGFNELGTVKGSKFTDTSNLGRIIAVTHGVGGRFIETRMPAHVAKVANRGPNVLDGSWNNSAAVDLEVRHLQASKSF